MTRDWDITLNTWWGDKLRHIGWKLHDPPPWYRKLHRHKLIVKRIGKYPRGWSRRAKIASWILRVTDDRDFTLDKCSKIQKFLRVKCKFGREYRGWIPHDEDLKY